MCSPFDWTVYGLGEEEIPLSLLVVSTTAGCFFSPSVDGTFRSEMVRDIGEGSSFRFSLADRLFFGIFGVTGGWSRCRLALRSIFGIDEGPSIEIKTRKARCCILKACFVTALPTHGMHVLHASRASVGRDIDGSAEFTAISRRTLLAALSAKSAGFGMHLPPLIVVSPDIEGCTPKKTSAKRQRGVALNRPIS